SLIPQSVIRRHPRSSVPLVNAVHCRRLSCPVSFRPLDHYLRDGPAECEPSFDVTAVVDPSPESRPRHFLRFRGDERRIVREKVRHHRRYRPRAAPVSRRITGMVRRWKERRDLGVELEWADRPISEFRIPAGDHDIVLGYTHQSVDSRRPRRVIIVPVFEDPLAGHPIPVPEYPATGLGEESLLVGIESPREVL